MTFFRPWNVETFTLGLLTGILTLHVASLGAGDFKFGLVVATALTGVVGYILLLASGKPQRETAVRRRRRAYLDWAAPIGIGFLCARAVLGWNFFDEEKWVGHLTIASQIAGGTYPPTLPGFPEYELRYHYGFDLIAAACMRIFRLTSQQAVDGVSLYSIAVAGLLWMRLGRRWFRSAAWAGLLVAFLFFAGGLPLRPELPSTGCSHPFPVCELMYRTRVDGATINPPFGIYLLQHPWSLGFLVLTLLLMRFGRPYQLMHWTLAKVGIFVALTALLSLSHIVLFANWIGWVSIHSIVVAKRSWQRALFTALLLGISVLVSATLRGFWIAPYADHEFFFRLGGFAGNWKASGLWTLLTFGVPLLLAGFGVRSAFRLLPAVPWLAVINLVVVHFVRYDFSTDIVKFATAAGIWIAVLSVFALNAATTRFARIVRPFAVATSLAWAVSFYFAFWTIPHLVEFPRARVVDCPDVGVAPSGLVYASRASGHCLATREGWHMPWVDDGVAASYGIPSSRLAAREALVDDIQRDFSRFETLGVQWVYLSKREVEELKAWPTSVAVSPYLRPVRDLGPAILYRYEPVIQGAPDSVELHQSR